MTLLLKITVGGPYAKSGVGTSIRSTLRLGVKSAADADTSRVVKIHVDSELLHEPEIRNSPERDSASCNVADHCGSRRRG